MNYEKTFRAATLVSCLIFCSCSSLLFPPPASAQITVLGKTPYDTVLPQFFNQNNNANSLIDALNLYGTHAFNTTVAPGGGGGGSGNGNFPQVSVTNVSTNTIAMTNGGVRITNWFGKSNVTYYLGNTGVAANGAFSIYNNGSELLSFLTNGAGFLGGFLNVYWDNTGDLTAQGTISGGTVQTMDGSLTNLSANSVHLPLLATQSGGNKNLAIDSAGNVIVTNGGGGSPSSFNVTQFASGGAGTNLISGVAITNAALHGATAIDNAVIGAMVMTNAATGYGVTLQPGPSNTLQNPQLNLPVVLRHLTGSAPGFAPDLETWTMNYTPAPFDRDGGFGLAWADVNANWLFGLEDSSAGHFWGNSATQVGGLFLTDRAITNAAFPNGYYPFDWNVGNQGSLGGNFPAFENTPNLYLIGTNTNQWLSVYDGTANNLKLTGTNSIQAGTVSATTVNATNLTVAAGGLFTGQLQDTTNTFSLLGFTMLLTTGDSRAACSAIGGSALGYPGILTNAAGPNGLGWTFSKGTVDSGSNGFTSYQVFTNRVVGIGNFLATNAGPNLVTLQVGYNDLSEGSNWTQIATNIANIINYAHTFSGTSIALFDEPFAIGATNSSQFQFESEETNRTMLNAWERRSSYLWDYFVDQDAIMPSAQVLENTAGTAPIGVHPNIQINVQDAFAIADAVFRGTHVLPQIAQRNTGGSPVIYSPRVLLVGTTDQSDWTDTGNNGALVKFATANIGTIVSATKDYSPAATTGTALRFVTTNLNGNGTLFAQGLNSGASVGGVVNINYYGGNVQIGPVTNQAPGFEVWPTALFDQGIVTGAASTFNGNITLTGNQIVNGQIAFNEGIPTATPDALITLASGNNIPYLFYTNYVTGNNGWLGWNNGVLALPSGWAAWRNDGGGIGLGGGGTPWELLGSGGISNTVPTTLTSTLNVLGGMTLQSQLNVHGAAYHTNSIYLVPTNGDANLNFLTAGGTQWTLASSSNTGSLYAAVLGNLPLTIQSNSVSGLLTLGGTGGSNVTAVAGSRFVGDGGGLISLNASALASGTIPPVVLNNANGTNLWGIPQIVANAAPYFASGSRTQTTGSISSNSLSLTVASAATFTVGEGVWVSAAGLPGSGFTNLVATITNIAGTTFTLNVKCSNTVSSVTVQHDDSAAINRALADAFNFNGGKVYLQGRTTNGCDGFYRCNGPFQGVGNGILTLPVNTNLSGGVPPHVILESENFGGYSGAYLACCIDSEQAEPAGTLPSIFSAGLNSQVTSANYLTNFNDVEIEVENLAFNAGAQELAGLSGLNFGNAQNASIDDHVGVFGSATYPTGPAAGTIGIYLPQTLNNIKVNCGGAQVAGFATGIVASELTHFARPDVALCISAYSFNEAIHLIYGEVCAQDCTYFVYVGQTNNDPGRAGGTTCPLDIVLTAEPAPGASAFALAAGGTLNDPAGIATGHFQYAVWSPNSGTVTNLPLTLGANSQLQVDDLNFPRFQKKVLSSTAASITFAVPANHTDLVLALTGISTVAANSDPTFVRFNGDSGADYNAVYYSQTQNSSVSAGLVTGLSLGNGTGSTGAVMGSVAGATSPATMPGTCEITVRNYSGSAFAKNFNSRDGGNLATGYAGQEFFAGWWTGTAPITTLTVYLPSGANFTNGTTATLEVK